MDSIRLNLPASTASQILYGGPAGGTNVIKSLLALPSGFHSADRQVSRSTSSRPEAGAQAHLEHEEDDRAPLDAESQAALLEILESLQLDDTALSGGIAMNRVPRGFAPNESSVGERLKDTVEQLAASLRVPEAFEKQADDREGAQLNDCQSFLAAAPNRLEALAALLPYVARPSAEVVMSLLALSPMRQPLEFSFDRASSVAKTIPRLQSLLLDLLKNVLPRLFSLHPKLSKTSGRPLDRPRGGNQALLDRFTDDPLSTPISSLAPILSFVFETLPASVLSPLLFSHILPPLLAFLDHHYPPILKRLGGDLLLTLLPKLEPARIKSTGTDALLLAAVGSDLALVVPLLNALHDGHLERDKSAFDALAAALVSPGADLTDAAIVRSLPPVVRRRFFPLFLGACVERAGQDAASHELLRWVWHDVFSCAGPGTAPAEREYAACHLEYLALSRERWRGSLAAKLGKAWVETRQRDELRSEFKATFDTILDRDEPKAQKWRKNLKDLDADVFGPLVI